MRSPNLNLALKAAIVIAQVSFVLSFSYIMLIVVFWLFLVHAHTLLLKEAFVYFYERLSWFLVVSALFIFLEGRETLKIFEDVTCYMYLHQTRIQLQKFHHKVRSARTDS